MAGNAKINIEVGVKSQRRTDQPFRPTEIVVETFHYETDQENYLSESAAVGTEVFEWLESQRADMWENGLSFHITLENVSNTVQGAGMILMPKGHRDGAMNGEEASSAQVISEWISTATAELIQRAKY